MLTRFHSVVVEVEDLEAGVRDYARLLGRPPQTAGDASPGRGRGAIFVLSNARLELRCLAESAALAPGLPRLDQEGIAGLRLACGSEPGPRLAPGPLDSPSVPIELVAEEADESPSDPLGSAALRAQTPSSHPAARVLGLDHVVVATRDPERARRFFAENLGVRLALDRSFAERGLRLMFFRLGGVTIEVASALAGTPGDGGPDAFYGLAWTVPSIEAIHARLREAGVEVSAIRAGQKPGTRVCSVLRPVHGVATLLIEQPAREGW